MASDHRRDPTGSPPAPPTALGAPAPDAPTFAKRAAPPRATAVTRPVSDLSEGATLPVPEGSLAGPVDPDAPPLGTLAFAERYQVRDLLGEGGMGQVLLCRDAQIGRHVAMKRIRGGVGSRSDAHGRFVREARVQGQLEHPSVVPVYDLGVDADGRAFFTMKRVRGHTLGDVIDGLITHDPNFVQKFSRRKLLAAFSSLCLAVDYVHSRGVVHRDLKPGNVMLGDYGEVYLLDWGLARVGGPEPTPDASAPPLDPENATIPAFELPDDGSARTADGAIMGTPGYMPAEQLRGDLARIDARTDVYALGAMLFELLALDTLHPLSPSSAAVASTLSGANARFSERCPQLEVPPELEAICVQATALEPKDRHPSARALHEEIEHFLDGDRDLELRRELAGKHAEQAGREASAALCGGPGSTEARSRAMREISRALALDPENRNVMATMVELLMEPPDETPDEVKESIARSAARQEQTSLRAGGIAFLASYFYVPFLLWMGVREPLQLVASQALCTVAGLWFILAARRGRVSFPMHMAMFLFGMVSVLSLSRIAGLFMVVPMLALLITVGFALTPMQNRRATFIGSAAAILVLATVLDRIGVMEFGVHFAGDTIVVAPQMVHFPALPTEIYLTALNAGILILGGWFFGKIRQNLVTLERRMHLHAWHLRKLVPDEALSNSGILETRRVPRPPAPRSPRRP